jgi:hypothetical protein
MPIIFNSKQKKDINHNDNSSSMLSKLQSKKAFSQADDSAAKSAKGAWTAGVFPHTYTAAHYRQARPNCRCGPRGGGASLPGLGPNFLCF